MTQRVRPSDIPGPVLELCRELGKGGYKAWIVGGCLRDLLRGRPAADWDLATSALPEQVQRVFPRVIPTGIQHGTVTVRHRGQSYEVTTLRGEGAYRDGRRPESVHFVEDIEADLARRDFTVNAMAYDPVAGQLVDPFGGLRDLDARLIRAVGRAKERFGEDGLRVLRAARFAATLEFSLDPETEAAIRPTLTTFAKVSAERVRDEWLKSFKAKRPSVAFAVMRRTGILDVTFPQLGQLPADRWSAALRAVDLAPLEPCVRLAALLSPLAAERDGLTQWLMAYRYSNHERERVLRMLESLPAQLGDSAAWSDAEVRRFAQRVGREWLAEVTALARVVAEAQHGKGSVELARTEQLEQRVAQLITKSTPLVAKELAVTGRDLMHALQLAPGPIIGRIVERLLDEVIEEPSLNSRERLLERARHCIKEEA